MSLNNELLTYIAIGDAYCMATEYIKSPRDDSLKEEALKFQRYLGHPSHGCKPGRYTDDTHMSIGNAEVLIEAGGNTSKIRDLDFASKWVEVYHRDWRNGYARGFQDFLNRTASGPEFLEKIYSNSNKNGAAMRAVPFGAIPGANEVARLARQQALITHATPGGLFSSQAIALMANFAIHEAASMTHSNLSQFLNYYLHEDLENLFVLGLTDKGFTDDWEGRVAGDEIGLITTWAVYNLLVRARSLKEILQMTIEWGGDTDSVASIALGIASCRRETDFEDDLPSFMLDCLEPGRKYGREFLNLTSKHLMSIYG